MNIYRYSLSIIILLLTMAAQPIYAQRISVGKKGLIKVMRTDSTSAQEYVKEQNNGTSISRSKKSNNINSLSNILKSDVDLNIPISKNTQGKTFAVIIANENYEEEVNVDYALNDGIAFSQYCAKTLGIPESNIHIRKDATLNNILAEMSWMENIAKAYGKEAKFIFYYAGHGVPAIFLPQDIASANFMTNSMH